MNSICLLVLQPPLALPTPASVAKNSWPARWVERIEAVMLRMMVALFLLAFIGCGFGVQHITYLRQKNVLGAQLREKELELAKAVQAYRSLELSIARLANPEECRATEPLPVAAKRPPNKKNLTRS